MNHKNNHIEFSFYELSLLSFLRESHPDKAGDISLIKSRATEVAEAYSNAFMDGYSVPECADIANQSLYRGLHFSKHDTIVGVLRDEFWDVVSSDVLKDTAIRLQPKLEEVFANYSPGDDFATTAAYERLRTELTGAIQLIWEENGSL
ncbi:DUF1896 domain-containing protein [Bacteroides thetaiotaomicron]|uniref:DUF1896 family protein n=1 Tax=Bacteroides thetaiotaomicron TaxID=818 RepID=UPI001C8BE8B8|nr:DUF1896 family protein [Bacteroides thetaiotaomicron]MBX9049597.1 DUF1896 domain-containing protein [Bacteroides thetaiotaomicron]MBX9074247.1 DUF1896 domain-containing protein [Bacteroides thetaiotaomicron]